MIREAYPKYYKGPGRSTKRKQACTSKENIQSSINRSGGWYRNNPISGNITAQLEGKKDGATRSVVARVFILGISFFFFLLVTSVNPVSSHPTDCADSEGCARDGVILGKSVAGTLDEELVSEEDGKDICLLVVHTSNSSGDVLT